MLVLKAALGYMLHLTSSPCWHSHSFWKTVRMGLGAEAGRICVSSGIMPYILRSGCNQLICCLRSVSRTSSWLAATMPAVTPPTVRVASHPGRGWYRPCEALVAVRGFACFDAACMGLCVGWLESAHRNWADILADWRSVPLCLCST